MIKDNKRQFIAMIIVTALATVINAFIIMQSCLNGLRSTASSGLVVNLFKSIINGVSPNTINDSNIGSFTHIIRKLVGHFGLFVLSGSFTSWSIYLMIKDQNWYKHYRGIYITLSVGLLLSALTEIIQLFIPDRSGEFTDVLIDFSGYLLGFCVVSLIIFLIYRHQKKNNINC